MLWGDSFSPCERQDDESDKQQHNMRFHGSVLRVRWFRKRNVSSAEINSDVTEEIKNRINIGLLTIAFRQSKTFGWYMPSCALPWM